MNINPTNHNPNFCARPVVGVSIKVSPQISRLTSISDIVIGKNTAIAKTRNGEVLTDNLQHIISYLREAVTELSWDHKYNPMRGTWVRR